MPDRVRLAVDDDRSRSADVDDAELAPLEERADRELLREVGRETELLAQRHRAADDDAVDLAVGQRKLSGNEDRVDQELAAQARGVERLRVVAVNRLTDVHGALGNPMTIERATPRSESSLAR